MSAGELEMLTLLGNPEQAKRKCFFDSEDEILLFLQSMGISQDSVRKLEHTRKQEGYVMKELICPNPLGNTFLLQYHWYGNHG